MIKSQNRTYTLPYDFKTISTNGRKTLNNTTDLEAQAKVVAKNTQDNFNLNSGNEWVKVETDATTNTITLSHDVKNTTSSTSEQNLSSKTDGTVTFQTVVDSYDATNHFSSRNTKTLTMPNSYGIITGDTGSSEATATHDTFAITTADEWLTSTVTKDKLVIAHEGAQTIVNSKGDTTAQAPKFGQSFKALSASIDAKGHVAQLAEHTITLPTPSLTNGTGNVVTGLILEPTTGALTESKANVGTLALTGYTTASSISAMPMATDSINTAIQKLAYVLDNKTDTVDTRIKALDSSITGLTSGEAITGITIEDGKITGHTTDKFDLAGAASKAIEGLDSATADLAENEVLTKVTLKSGKLTGTGLQLGTAALKATEDFVSANEDLSTKSITSGDSSMTIAQMLAKIVELETTVAQLQEKVTALEKS